MEQGLDTTQSDAELLKRHLSGDSDAFESLVQRHAHMVHRACRRMLGDAHEAEDAAQAVFVILSRRAHEFRKGGDLAAWLHGISRKVAAESMRSRARRKRREEEWAMRSSDATSDALSQEQRVAALESLDRELGRLPLRERQAVVLRYLEGRSLNEAAAIAGCPSGTLGRLTHDGLNRLRARLSGKGALLSIPAVTALLEAEAATALPNSLVNSILTATSSAAVQTGTDVAGTSALKSIGLANGAMKSMTVAKCKLVAAAVSATLVVGASIPLGIKLVNSSAAEAPVSGFREHIVWKNKHRDPSVIMTASGALLAFSSHRKSSAADLNDALTMKRSNNGGKTWGPEMVLAGPVLGVPCPVFDSSSGTVWLLYSKDRKSCFVISSRDEGNTWSEPRELPGPVNMVGPGQGLCTTSGRLLAPAHTRSAFCYYSDDGGATWLQGQPVQALATSGSLVERADNTIYMNLKGRTSDTERFQAISRDGGKSWEDVRPDGQLPGVYCHASIIRLTDAKAHDRNRILFCGPEGPGRKNLAIYISYNECRTWQRCRVIAKGQVGFSDLVVLPDLSIGCLYESHKEAWQSIRFARFTLEWLTDGKDRCSPGDAAAR